MHKPEELAALRLALEEATEAETPVRIQRTDGEEILARVLGRDGDVLLYAVYTSTHPERYGVCDSTGFRLSLTEISSIALSDAPPPRPLFSLDRI